MEPERDAEQRLQQDASACCVIVDKTHLTSWWYQFYFPWHWHVVHSADLILRTAAIKRHQCLWQSWISWQWTPPFNFPSVQRTWDEARQWGIYPCTILGPDFHAITWIILPTYGQTTRCETHTEEEEDIVRKILKCFFPRTAFQQLKVLAG